MNSFRAIRSLRVLNTKVVSKNFHAGKFLSLHAITFAFGLTHFLLVCFNRKEGDQRCSGRFVGIIFLYPAPVTALMTDIYLHSFRYFRNS